MKGQHYNVSPCVLNQGREIQLQCCTSCSLCLLVKELVKKLKRKDRDKGDLAKVKEVTKKQRAKEINRGDNER